MNSNFKIFLKGIVDVSPLMIPVVPFGLIFGVLARKLDRNHRHDLNFNLSPT